MRRAMINAGLGVLSALVGGAGFLVPVQANAAPTDDQPTNPDFVAGYPKPLGELRTTEKDGHFTTRTPESKTTPDIGEDPLMPDQLMKAEIAPDKYAYMYCVEPSSNYWYTGTMTVGGWSDYPELRETSPTQPLIASDKKRQEAAQWIAENSYPLKSIEQLRTDSGIADLSVEDAISGTRFSLLHYVDDRELGKVTPTSATKTVKGLYDYLTGPANTGASLDAPVSKMPKVSVTGPSDSGVAGKLVGPIRFGGTEKTLPLTVSDPASNWEIVDTDGNTINKTKAPVGKDLYLKVPADAPAGSTTISTTVKRSSLIGKLLINKKGKRHGQTTVIVDSDKIQASASVTVSWKAAPTPAPTPKPTPTPCA
ncbi:thioester domain-containing protein, partial [Cutibacterium granulosum]